MASLIDETPLAEAWLDSKREDLSMLAQYGRIVDAVLWTSSLTDEGTPLVDVEPNRLVEEVNSKGLPLLLNHDPGAPRGMVLCAGQFTSPSGIKFVAGLIGMYAQGDCLSFESIGIGDLPPVQPPKLLSPLSEEGYISVAVDPREVDETWIGELLLEPPILVKYKELSHNALEASAELIRVALPYVLLVRESIRNSDRKRDRQGCLCWCSCLATVGHYETFHPEQSHSRNGVLARRMPCYVYTS